MSLKDRLNIKNEKKENYSPEDNFLNTMPVSEEFSELKNKLHYLLIEKVNSTPRWSTYSDDKQKELIAEFVEEQVHTNFSSIPLNKLEKERLIKEIIQETKGFGPLDTLLEDPGISDILVNGPKNVYIEKNGKLYRTNVEFKDNEHLRSIIERIVSKVGRRIDEKSPMVDARLPDGSRVNAIIPPLAIDGPSLSIRRFKSDIVSMKDLFGHGSLTCEIAKVLEIAVMTKANIIISGGTGSGKTTLLNTLSAKIPSSERIITIEDSAELHLQQTHVVRLETRPANIEGAGAVSARDLLINSLRMRPDRIIIGECRGQETLDMLQAMNTGHEGSLTTLHASSTRDALSRLETMVMYSGFELPEKNIRSQIASAVDLIIQLARLSDGSKKVVKVSEIIGMEGSVIVMQDIFVWQQTGVEKNKVIGYHRSTGIRPNFLEKAKLEGYEVNSAIFSREYKHTYSTDSKESGYFIARAEKTLDTASEEKSAEAITKNNEQSSREMPGRLRAGSDDKSELLRRLRK